MGFTDWLFGQKPIYGDTLVDPNYLRPVGKEGDSDEELRRIDNFSSEVAAMLSLLDEEE